MTGVASGAQATEANRPSVLSRLQRGIESLYRVDTQLDVTSFLINDDDRRQSGVARAPREQLLVQQNGDDEVRIGLFLDQRAVSNLEEHDPARGLHHANFADFCLAVEGVSHFVYVALCAAGTRRVSALELELQAEVDKFACCLLVAGGDATHNGGHNGGHSGGHDSGHNGYAGGRDGDGHARDLRRKLYDDVTFADDLDDDEHDRYRVANLEARRYTATLSRQFLARDRVSDMLPELRRFYRLPLEGKLGHIARVAS